MAYAMGMSGTYNSSTGVFTSSAGQQFSVAPSGVTNTVNAPAPTPAQQYFNVNPSTGNLNTTTSTSTATPAQQYFNVNPSTNKLNTAPNNYSSFNTSRNVNPSGMPAPLTQGGQTVNQNINEFQKAPGQSTDIFTEIGVGIPIAAINAVPFSPFRINEQGKGTFSVENMFTFLDPRGIGKVQEASKGYIASQNPNTVETVSALTYLGTGLMGAGLAPLIGGTAGLVAGGSSIVIAGGQGIPLARQATGAVLPSILGQENVKIKDYSQETELAKIGIAAAQKDYTTNILQDTNPFVSTSGQIVNFFLPFASTALRQPAGQEAIYNKLISEGYSPSQAEGTAKFISVKYISGGGVGGTLGFAGQNIGTEVIGLAGARTALGTGVTSSEKIINKMAFAKTALGVAPAGAIEGVAYSRQEDMFNLNAPNAWKDLMYGSAGALTAGVISGLAVGTSAPYTTNKWKLGSSIEKFGTLLGGQGESEGNLIGERYAQLVGENKINFNFGKNQSAYATEFNEQNPGFWDKASNFFSGMTTGQEGGGASKLKSNLGKSFVDIASYTPTTSEAGAIQASGFTDLAGEFGGNPLVPSMGGTGIGDWFKFRGSTNVFNIVDTSPNPVIPIDTNPNPVIPIDTNPNPVVPTDTDTKPEIPTDTDTTTNIINNTNTNVDIPVIVPTSPGLGFPFFGLPGGDAFGSSGKGRSKKKYYNELDAAFAGFGEIDLLGIPKIHKAKRKAKK